MSKKQKIFLNVLDINIPILTLVKMQLYKPVIFTLLSELLLEKINQHFLLRFNSCRIKQTAE